MTEKLKPGMEHERLQCFIGQWRTEGKTIGNDSVQVSALDAYEWLPGGFFLLHRWNARIGDAETQGMEIIGYDAAKSVYFTQSYDDQGNVANYKASLQGRNWKVWGATERFAGEFSANGNLLKGQWEICSDGRNWSPWMDLQLTKIS